MITLMMVTYNRLDLTKKTIIGLKQSVKIPYKLVIVDNGSNDGTIEYLNTLSGDIELILLPKNHGIAVGRNIALRTADGFGTEWYCTIDNDVEMPVGWLEEGISILKANPSYGAIGVNFENTTYPLVTKNGYTFQDKPQGNLGTACMIFGKPLHKAIGFFKEYNKYGLEDSDFGMRARFFGFKLGYIKENGVHLGVGSEDSGEYRKFKTYAHDSKVQEFRSNCSLYAQKKLPIYLPYQDEIAYFSISLKDKREII
ncbi:MAG: glycosyltransferase [Clostridia bacterium]|jgi:GT2 family glycosyltransferase